MPSSIEAIARGLLLSAMISAGAALPSPSAATSSLSTADPSGSGTFLWLSKVTPTIFGQDATQFDYYLDSHPAAAQAAVASYAHAVAGGKEEDVVTAFLNATMAGTLSAAHASDAAWKCQELGGATASAVTSCAGVAGAAPLASRSTYTWKKSKSHHSSASAVDALAGALGRNPTFEFPTSPRSYCVTVDGTTACLSWSRVQSFTHGTGEGYISDAQSVVEFNTYSAQANGILGTGKKADVCISNRASGCT